MFKKPTELEVLQQFQLKGITDPKPPQIFYAHYESVGWHVGKRKMVSWKGALAKWILRMDEFNYQKPTKTPDQKLEDLNRAHNQLWS